MKKMRGARITQVISRMINVRKWLDWDRVKFYTQYLFTGISRLFVPDTAKKTESFSEATERLKLNEKDLLVKQKSLWRLAIVMVTAAILIFFYTLYLIYYGAFSAALISIVVMLIALTLAFRYHFWYFQIKHHKLGCSIEEWFKQGLMGEKE